MQSALKRINTGYFDNAHNFWTSKEIHTSKLMVHNSQAHILNILKPLFTLNYCLIASVVIVNKRKLLLNRN